MIRALVLAAVTFSGIHAYAMGDIFGIEIRAHYGAFSAPSDLNSMLNQSVSGWGSFSQPKVLGADLLYQPPLLPIVIGARYETFSASTGSVSYTNNDPGHSDNGDHDTVSSKLSGSRIAALVGYRVDLPMAFVGFLANVGISQNMTFNINLTDNTSSANSFSCNCEGKVSTSYGAGVEGGLRLGTFELGAELGYLSFKANSFNYQGSNLTFTPTGGTAQTVTANLSGVYYKAFLGVHF